MPEKVTTGGEQGVESLSVDDVFTVLSNQRRRLVLRYLKAHDGPVRVRELSHQVAAWENDLTVEELNYKQRKRVYTSLHQTHLPKLADCGIIAYDRNRGTVTLTDRVEELDFYFEVVRPNDIPWSQYYLGLAAVSLALVLARAVGLYPFTLVPEIGYAVLVAGALAVSAAVHTYYLRAFDDRAKPPDVDGFPGPGVSDGDPEALAERVAAEGENDLR
ncbi:MAG: hypothetical protein ABEJ22_07165 [Haloferacaceae archaeon]